MGRILALFRKKMIRKERRYQDKTRQENRREERRVEKEWYMRNGIYVYCRRTNPNLKKKH